MLRLLTKGLSRAALKLLLLVPLIWAEGAWAVDCANTNYDLNSQAEVDALGATGCDRVSGYLDIRDSTDITNLDGLANLTSVGGTLVIDENDALTNLDGLANLYRVGGFLRIDDNGALTNLDGLASLTSVGTSVGIYNNDAITNLDGLASLTSVGSFLSIHDNDVLTNLDGLANLSTVGNYLRISYNSALTNLDGLANLTSVGRDLNIYINDAITNLDGLASLTSVGGDLTIQYNYNATCEGVAPLLGWPNGPPDDTVGGSITIRYNGAGCGSVEQVLAAVSYPTQPVINQATTSSTSISLAFTPSTATNTAFPITGYNASCIGADVNVSGSPATDLLDNTPIQETLTITGYDPTSVLASIEVDIDVTHARPEHLYITLTTPEGTEVVLWNQGGAGTENLVGTFPTTLTPVDSLDNVSRQTMDGDWVLSVEDIQVGPLVREGVLNSWGIGITEELARSGSGSPIEVLGATRDRDYACTVAPITKLGTGLVSDPYTAFVPFSPFSPPSAPTITSTDFEDGTIILTVSVSDNGGTDITGYNATCTDGTNTFTAASTSSAIAVSGLTNDVAYTCTVTASNSVGTSSTSAATDPITPEDAISGLPIWLLYSISAKSIDNEDGGDNEDGVSSFVVAASADTGGSISPSGDRAVAEGGTLTFTLTADSGFSFNRISGSCPSGTTSATTHTTGAITANCTVVAEFTANNSSGYCAGTPAGVICDPNSDGRRNPGGNMDPWAEGLWGFENTPIPNGKVVAYPFLANGGASGASGIVQFTNNMGDLTVSGYRWKGWFSESPGGAVLNGAIACRKFSANPNPINMQWSQAANSGSFDCNLGQAERVLYFNMTVGCFEEGRACTVGAPFPGQPGYDAYYVKVYPR